MQTYTGLIDIDTNAIMTIQPTMAPIVWLKENAPNVDMMPRMQFPNNSEIIQTIQKAGNFYNYTWNRKNRTITSTEASLITPALIAKSELLHTKAKIVWSMINVINATRHNSRTGLHFQETVYITKRSQAEEFKASGYDERYITNYPYVIYYADLVDITYQEAADDILLKAKLSDQVLAKTEQLRMKYFRLLKQVQVPTQLEPLFDQFKLEAFTNAQV